MVLSFVGLRGASREAAFRLFAQDRVRAGFTRNIIANQAKKAGFGIRRGTMLRIGREYEGRAIAAPRMVAVGDLRIPGMDHYGQTDWRLKRRFQTIFEVRGRNVLTGEPATRSVSFLHDERMAVGDMKRELLEKVQREYALREGVDYFSIVPVEGLERASPPFIAEA